MEQKQQTSLSCILEGQITGGCAEVIAVILKDDGRFDVILNHTVFYPQGGGQPFDTGYMKREDKQFTVEEVRLNDGVVSHIGRFKGVLFQPGKYVELFVDEERRVLNSRLHTAGHLIDIALCEQGMELQPVKGYHFPQGPYVEYEGVFDNAKKEEFIQKLQETIDFFISKNLSVIIETVDPSELKELCKNISPNILQNKPTRVMIIDGYEAIPCGGTHVEYLKELEKICITKIKNKKGRTRIGYSVS
jgi:Ser-tRNA(Ala) deacylase AlaX